ncbi:hypothetical protein H6P81_005976 [Aristolochia fimbriata]|uniref:Uncharacterized protein n=1 Tax=Aristolochia fimbriata TaxID=158543 RepID=A0AAV7EZI9_ARIFI|nr:hypothetical protein H6P81_005976 [Aristolochia fimbriata]
MEKRRGRRRREEGEEREIEKRRQRWRREDTDGEERRPKREWREKRAKASEERSEMEKRSEIYMMSTRTPLASCIDDSTVSAAHLDRLSPSYTVGVRLNDHACSPRLNPTRL